MNSPYKFSRRVTALADLLARSCEFRVNHVVMKDANAPTADPPRAANAEMYAVSMGASRRAFSCVAEAARPVGDTPRSGRPGAADPPLSPAPRRERWRTSRLPYLTIRTAAMLKAGSPGGVHSRIFLAACRRILFPTIIIG